jgi:Fe2+ transport system protein FeoA
MTLKDCELNKTYIVEGINMDNKNNFNKICSLGILPGAELTVIRKKPIILFTISHSTFGIDTTLANNIYVKIADYNKNN